MSLMEQPRRCSCCGQPHGRGCIKGPQCNCMQTKSCPGCWRCIEHCICSKQTSENTQGQVRTLAEVLDIIQVWDQVIMKRMDHPQAEYLGDLPWLAVVEQYLDGATPEQLERAWEPDEVPEGYIPRPLQRQAILEDFQKFVQQAWSSRETGTWRLDNDLIAIDAYLWLLKDEEAIRTRRRIYWNLPALSWICDRYGFQKPAGGQQ